MPGTTRYSATFDRPYEEQDAPAEPPTARRSRSQSWQATNGFCYSPLGASKPPSRSSSIDNGTAKGAEQIPTRTAGKASVKAHSNPFQFVKVGTCPLYKKAEEQLKKVKEVKKKDVLKEEEEEWQTNLDSWKTRRRKMSEDVFKRQEEIRQLEKEEEQFSQGPPKKTKTFSEMVESRAHRGRTMSLCLLSSPLDLQNWEFENNRFKNNASNSHSSEGSEGNSTVNSEDEGVSCRDISKKNEEQDTQNVNNTEPRQNGDHSLKNGEETNSSNNVSRPRQESSQDSPLQKESAYVDSGLESISSHRTSDIPDSGSDFSQDSGSSIDCDSPRISMLENGLNLDFSSKFMHLNGNEAPNNVRTSGIEVTLKFCLNNGEQDFGFSFSGGKDRKQVARVTSVMEGGIAKSVGLLVGDEILAIDGKHLSFLDYSNIANLIKESVNRKQMELLLWRHIIPENCVKKEMPNGTVNSVTPEQTATKSELHNKTDKQKNENSSKTKSEGLKKINSKLDKKASAQQEKSIESENEVFVDDFVNLNINSQAAECSETKKSPATSKVGEKTQDKISSVTSSSVSSVNETAKSEITKSVEIPNGPSTATENFFKKSSDKSEDKISSPKPKSSDKSEIPLLKQKSLDKSEDKILSLKQKSSDKSEDKIPLLKQKSLDKSEDKISSPMQKSSGKIEDKIPLLKQKSLDKNEDKIPSLKQKLSDKSEDKIPLLKQKSLDKSEDKISSLIQKSSGKSEDKVPSLKQKLSDKSEDKISSLIQKPSGKSEDKVPSIKQIPSDKSEDKISSLIQKSSGKSEDKVPSIKQIPSDKSDDKIPSPKQTSDKTETTLKKKPTKKKLLNSTQKSTAAVPINKEDSSLNIIYNSQSSAKPSQTQESNVTKKPLGSSKSSSLPSLKSDILPVEKVAEEMEKLILQQLEEEEQAKEMASDNKGVIVSADNILTAPPRQLEPPKEKPPPPPPSVTTDSQVGSSLKRVNSTKRIKKEIHKRRSNFLGIENADESSLCDETKIPPPPALEDILKAEMELDRESRKQLENAAAERLSLAESELMKKEREIIENLESEERRRLLMNGIEDPDAKGSLIDGSAVSPDKDRIEMLKEEKKRAAEEKQLGEEQKIRSVEEKQLREREEQIRKQEDNNSATLQSSASLAANSSNMKPSSNAPLPSETKPKVSLSDGGGGGDGKTPVSVPSSTLNSETNNITEEKPVSVKPNVPPKPLKKKEAIRKERERLRQEQEALQRDREEHRRRLLLEQEEILKSQQKPHEANSQTSHPQNRQSKLIPSRGRSSQNESWGQQKVPSVKKQNHNSLTESRYNQNHWLIQEAEMRRIAELKERQRTAQLATATHTPYSQAHLAEDDVCSVATRPPSGPHSQVPNYTPSGFGPSAQGMKKYPPAVSSDKPLMVYPRDNAAPTKPSRITPMERQEQMLSVSGRKRCSHCGEELGRGAAMIIESLQLYYHIHCFQCCVCQAQLGNGSCGTDVRVRNNKLHCHNCYSNDEAGLKFSQV